MYKYFTIGEMAKLHKISIHTLRYYDEIDLFKPVYVDKQSNYRYYSLEQFSQLDIIKYLKHLGMPLKEIKLKLDENNEDTLDLLSKKINVVDQKIKELELIKKVLKAKKDTLEKGSSSDLVGIIRKRNIKRRSILSMEYEEGINHNEKMELSRRRIANILEENISVFYGGVSGLISIESVIRNKKVTYEKSFVEVERVLFNENAQQYITEIPAGEFVCMIYKGPYSKNYGHVKKLIDYLEYKRIDVEDKIYEIPIKDPLSTSCEDELLTELQVKVKRPQVDLRCLV